MWCDTRVPNSYRIPPESLSMDISGVCKDVLKQIRKDCVSPLFVPGVQSTRCLSLFMLSLNIKRINANCYVFQSQAAKARKKRQSNQAVCCDLAFKHARMRAIKHPGLVDQLYTMHGLKFRPFCQQAFCKWVPGYSIWHCLLVQVKVQCV